MVLPGDLLAGLVRDGLASVESETMEEFRKLADEFTLKASELERLNPPRISTKHRSEDRE